MTQISSKITTNNLQIGIIGPYPKPYGGVAIHIERLCNLLDNSRYQYHIYHIFSTKSEKKEKIDRIKNPCLWYPKYLLLSKDKIVHLHTTDYRVCLVFGLITFKRKTKLIITIHSTAIPDYISHAPIIMKKIMANLINRTHLFITVNDEFRESLLASLIPVGVNPEKIKTISPYLPPTITEDDYESMDSSIQPFVDSHTPIISANAFKLHKHNGVQLYGMDMCVELCGYLKQKYPNIGVILCISVMDYPDEFERLQSRIKELGIQNNILVLTDGESFPPILSLSDVFVRPTNTDGDAVSIREAMSLGVPAIASDVVRRPDGCIIFKCRNQEDFEQTVVSTLENKDAIISKIRCQNIDENYPLIDIYKEILNSS